MARIVILGGGFGGIFAAEKLLSKLGNSSHKILLVNKDENFVFRPLLHEVAAGFLQEEDITQNIPKMFKGNNFEFVKANVEKIYFNENKVLTTSGSLGYDYLLIALGGNPRLEPVIDAGGNPAHVFTLSNPGDAARILSKLNELNEKFAQMEGENKLVKIVFIGAGATSIELAGEVSDFFMKHLKCSKDELPKKISINMIEKFDKILPQVDDEFRKKALEKLDMARVELLYSSDLQKIEEGSVTIKTADKLRKIRASMIILAAGVKPVMLDATPNVMAAKGGIEVDNFLQVKGTMNAWAVGDCTYCLDATTGKPVPMLAQAAKDQGIFAAENILSAMQSRKQEKYSFTSKGFILSIGQGFAIGRIYQKLIHGWWMWWLKRTIYSTIFIGFSEKLRKLWSISLKNCGKRK